MGDDPMLPVYDFDPVRVNTIEDLAEQILEACAMLPEPDAANRQFIIEALQAFEQSIIEKVTQAKIEENTEFMADLEELAIEICRQPKVGGIDKIIQRLFNFKTAIVREVVSELRKEIREANDGF